MTACLPILCLTKIPIKKMPRCTLFPWLSCIRSTKDSHEDADHQRVGCQGPRPFLTQSQRQHHDKRHLDPEGTHLSAHLMHHVCIHFPFLNLSRHIFCFTEGWVLRCLCSTSDFLFPDHLWRSFFYLSFCFLNQNWACTQLHYRCTLHVRRYTRT